MKKIFTMFVMFLVLFFSTNIFAQVSFSGKTDFTLGGGTNTLTTADINGDGKQDIIATRAWFSETVTVLLNTTAIGAATPTFSIATDFTIGGGNHTKIAVADLNGDGKPDIIASESFTGTVSVLLNTTIDGASTPSFSSYTSFTVGAADWSVEIGDVNGDGKPDIVTANLSANTVSVLLNTTTNGASTPTFSSKTDFTVGQSPVSVSIGDVNGDGKPDIVTANQGASTVSVLLNTTSNGASTPTFTSKTDFAAGATTYSVIIGDVNGDEKPDIITANFSDNTASVLLNTTSNGASTPTFSGKTDFAVGTSPQWVAIADFDSDGKSDVVTANSGTNNVSVLINTTTIGASTPTFSSKSDFGVGTSPLSVTNADINGDNKIDIITSNNTTASVLLNTTSFPSAIIWDGSASADWNDGDNWSTNVVPTAFDNVTIPDVATNDPIISSAPAVCNNLTISWGGSLTISAGKSLTVSGNLINTGTFTINSDASSNGSLILNGTSTGNITYNRYVTGVDKWHLVSSPVGAQYINTFVVTNASNAIAANGLKYGLAPYDNSTPGWAHYTTSTVGSAGRFTAGKGYEVLRTSDGTVAFTGTVATSDVSIGISAPVAPGNPWNLIGNPFPSAVKGNSPADGTNNFISANAAALEGAYQAIYVWDAASSSYLTVNHTYSSSTAFYVAPGQAFFVYSVAGGATVNFSEAMQNHQTGNIFKSGVIPAPSIKLIAERTEGTTSTNILYLESMSTGLDPGYDAGRFSGGNNSFAVYTHLVGDNTNPVDFDIQCLPANEWDHIIPVGLNAPKNTEVVFRAEVMSLPTDVPVYLEDKVTGTFTVLNEPGSFYTVKLSEQSQGTGRFFLHTQSSVTGIGPLANEADFSLIPRPQYNSIRVIGRFDSVSQISVYDMAGRKLLSRKLNATEINDVEMDGIISGVYVVYISSSPTKSSGKKLNWIRN